jgi:hypothetical protein
MPSAPENDSAFSIPPSASTSSRWLLAALLAGAVLRILLLPLGGTGDVVVWKVWSYGATYNVTGMYGVGGSPPNQRVVHWNGEAMTVDYPPIALYELALVGRAYARLDPLYRDSQTLTVLIKTPGLLLEIALVALILTWGRRRYGDRVAFWAAAATWLNPALLLNGPALGYLDPTMYVPLVVAIVAAAAGAPWLAGIASAAAVLTKAQAIFALPVVVALVCRRGPAVIRHFVQFAAAGMVTAVVVILPFLWRGAFPNMLQSLSRLAAHDMISAQAANIWWVVTWMIRVADSVQELGWVRALTQPVRILAISVAIDVGYPNFRAIGLVLVAAVNAVAVWWAWRARSIGAAAAIAAWSLYAYAMLAAQVHENHLVPAVPVLAIAAALDSRLRSVYWGLSVIAALNLYLFYGLAPGLPPLVDRGATGIDMTVVLSIVNVGVFVWFTRLLLRQPERVEAAR